MALKKVLVSSISTAALILGIRLIAPCRRPGARRRGAVRAKRSEAETRALVQRYGQSHVLEHWEELDSSQQERLLEDLSTIDFPFLTSVFRKTQEADERQSSASAPAPVEDSAVIEISARTADQVAGWRDRGLRLIAEGKVAILLLAGGQGTRLGSSMPKGCYSIGLPSGKSLFQLQAERLQRLQALARQRHPKAANPPLRWYIMTSKFTDMSTKAYFEDQRYFDLHLSQIHFFQQDFLPCLSMDGQIIMQSRSAAAKSPDGNGGVYLALEESGVLDDMEANGIRCLDCYCVDNALARPGDPMFLGACSERGAELAARVVAKAHPQERVGVFCEPAGGGGGLSVVEYSELPPEEAAAVNPATGRALYNWGNICMHYFTTSFLRKAAQHVKKGVRFHKAVKSIPSKDGPVQGIKLEYFIFDPFHLARSSLLFEVERSAEFAPVKNAPGSASDSPDTARSMLLALHRRWVEAAGGQVVLEDGAGAVGPEVSPMVSYGGEGLEDICQQRVFTQPFDIFLQGTVPGNVYRSGAAPPSAS